jgi:transcriptional regulator GlxA family with amidase domain
MTQANADPITVDIVAVPETAASGLYGFVDLLSSVGVAWESTVTHAPVAPRFSVRTVAASRRPFRCVSGALVTPDAAIDDVDTARIVLIPAVRATSTDRWLVADPAIYDWLSSLDPSQTRIVSACTGALILAEAGILDGHEATTHWAYRDAFRRFYPQVHLRFEKNLCISGENGRLVTSGGASAWQTLALYLIAQYCGQERAIQTAKFWLLADAGKLQSPYAAMLKRRHDDPVIGRCEEWIGAHFAMSNPVDTMMERSGLAPTTFSRRFKRATDYSPIEYVQAVRMEKAKHMLESEHCSVEEICHFVGYEDIASFRRLFKRSVGVTPSDYRKRLGTGRFGNQQRGALGEAATQECG